MEKVVSGAVMLALGLLMVPPAFAVSIANPASESDVLVSASASGPWSPGRAFAGQWITTQQEDGAIVALPGGVTAKLAKGSTVHVDDTHLTRLSGLNGRIFIHVGPSGGQVAVDTSSLHVSATQGEMVVDSAGATKLTVLSGDATMTVKAAPVSALLKKAKLVALDGPDVRSRSTEADEFNRRKKARKGAGVKQAPVNPPTNNTPPVENPVPPAETPPVTPPPATPPVTPPPTTITPTPAVAVVGGSATPWIVLGSLLVVGGGVAIAVTQTHHNNTVTTPASP